MKLNRRGQTEAKYTCIKGLKIHLRIFSAALSAVRALPLFPTVFLCHRGHINLYSGENLNGANVLCFLSSLPLLPPSVWVLPVFSLLLTNTVLPSRACLIIGWERFRGSQTEDDRRPLSIQSSLAVVPAHPKKKLPVEKEAVSNRPQISWKGNF